MDDGPSSPGARSKRLRRLRQEFGPTQVAFCRKYGFTVTQWSNFERGGPLGFAAAQQLYFKIPGLSLDWFYSGHVEGLTIGMARILGELPDSSHNNTGA